MAVETGEQLGPYEIRAPLGAGGVVSVGPTAETNEAPHEG